MWIIAFHHITVRAIGLDIKLFHVSSRRSLKVSKSVITSVVFIVRMTGVHRSRG